MLFKKKIQIPSDHVCVVSRNGCFRQILPPGVYKLHRTLDQTTPIFPLFNQTITGVITATTRDKKDINLAYQINYDITDIYMFTVGTHIWNDTTWGSLEMAKDITVLCRQKVERMTYSEAQMMLSSDYILQDRESTMIFEGLQRYGTTVTAARMKLCTNNIKPYQEDSCGLDAICFKKPQP